eukprot:UN09910
MSLKELQTLYKKFDGTRDKVSGELDLIESGQSDDPHMKIQQDIAPKVKEMFNILESIKFAYRDLNDQDKS